MSFYLLICAVMAINFELVFAENKGENVGKYFISVRGFFDGEFSRSFGELSDNVRKCPLQNFRK